MKKTLLIVLPLLLIVGCSSEKEPINIDTTLNESEGIFYTKYTKKPYTGHVFHMHKPGQKMAEGSLVDGKMDGKGIIWSENGEEKNEVTFREGELLSKEYLNVNDFSSISKELEREISHLRKRKAKRVQELAKSIDEKGHLGTLIDIIKNPKKH